MKKAIISFLVCQTFLFSSLFAHEYPYLPGCDDELTRMQRYSNETYLPYGSTEDGGFTATATSMLGWGIALGLVFAIVSASISPSTAPAN